MPIEPNKKIYVVTIIIVAFVMLFIVGLNSLANTLACQNDLFQISRSPTEDVEAQVFERSCDATTTHNRQVRIMDQRNLFVGLEKTLKPYFPVLVDFLFGKMNTVFSMKGDETIQADWQNNETLVIRYPQNATVYFKHPQWDTITVKYIAY